MKIDADLREAIRSAEKIQPSLNYREKEQNMLKRIESLKKGPKSASMFNAATAIRKEIESREQETNRLRDKAALYFGQLGLNRYGTNIENEAQFIKAGGSAISPELGHWTFDQAMSDLALADPKDRNKILLRYGIRWE